MRQNQGENLNHCDDVPQSHVSFAVDNEYFEPLSILDEYLHDPATLPSNHLNVTVIVKGKDEEEKTSVRRAVEKCVLDTANYSLDFISFDMIKTLNAFDACYEAPRAITVCSGLDGTCYVINENIDV